MPRRYRHMQDYEKEIIELINQGETLREIGNKLGFTYKQMRNFKTRYNKKQRKIEAGKTIRKKGRPCKKDGELPPSVQKLDKLAQMRYAMASKDRYIKKLEMEIKLMQDFLLLTERK